jgi:hypothetical protein
VLVDGVDGEVEEDRMIRMTRRLLILANDMEVERVMRVGDLDSGVVRREGLRLGIWLVERAIRDNRRCRKEEVDGLVVEIVVLHDQVEVGRVRALLLDIRALASDRLHGGNWGTRTMKS